MKSTNIYLVISPELEAQGWRAVLLKKDQDGDYYLEIPEEWRGKDVSYIVAYKSRCCGVNMSFELTAYKELHKDGIVSLKGIYISNEKFFGVAFIKNPATEEMMEQEILRLAKEYNL